jgi:hypothetical protein
LASTGLPTEEIPRWPLTRSVDRFALALVVDAPPTEVAGDQILFDEPA